MKRRTHAERILRITAFHYADARMQLLQRPLSEWFRGFADGRAAAALSILKNFLRDMPRRVQLEIGTRIRSEIAEFKARHSAIRNPQSAITPAAA